jgi:hypothetical protein
MFLPLVAKSRYLHVFLANAQQKHFWYLRSFHHVARSTFSMPKAQKHCKLQCYGLWHPPKNQQNPPKSAQNGKKCLD